MTYFTDVLVRHKNGWTMVRKADADVRKAVTQGHPGDTPEAVRRARAEVATYGTGQTELTLGIDVTDADPTPGIDWAEGDEVNADNAWREVEAWSFSIADDTGRWTDMPQFGTLFDTPQQRFNRAVKHIGGLTAGTSKLARPIAEVPPPDVRPDQNPTPC